MTYGTVGAAVAMPDAARPGRRRRQAQYVAGASCRRAPSYPPTLNPALMPSLTMNHPFSTVRDLLRYAVTRFNQAQLAFGHGSANAYDEAAYLVLHTLHLPLDTLDPFLDARLLDEEVGAVLDIIERRVTQRFAGRLSDPRSLVTRLSLPCR
ncbi:Ribosomal protein L3P methyltransferase (EC 2.1.1.-) [Mycetohabitans rhizoxinica HKI 454]|uniref:Ribosomal protein L3P methyltransferase n=1 Tax=Mycetohabitans rhizoxinica (strain DSM 19002 / CIP 109453 / HKI 454) TaxID=882378 RepID=E5AQX7_MYCRK|nr:Ribosomal protein L3P methyltransferase (EC 2.1.1.-) [Mycetohabitans rhizoxinica HKI 454]